MTTVKGDDDRVAVASQVASAKSEVVHRHPRRKQLRRPRPASVTRQEDDPVRACNKGLVAKVLSSESERPRRNKRRLTISPVKHRTFLQGYSKRYRTALNALGEPTSQLLTEKENGGQKYKEKERSPDDVSNTSETALETGKAMQDLKLKGYLASDDSSSDLFPETPPPRILNLLEDEVTLCDSPKDRGVVGDLMELTRERLPFGYFHCGQQIYRNKLNDQELLQDGFVALHQLVLPHCRSALMTTFDSGVMMKASINLASEVCPDVPKVLLVGHGDFLGMPFCGVRLPCATINSKAPYKQKREWHWMACRPFGRSELLMHAKILLFRSDNGLRIVVSGNNLTEKQWTEDRDCLWIQDVPASVAVQRNLNPSGSSLEPPMTRLRCFLIDLLKSSVAFHDVGSFMDEELLSFVNSRVADLLDSLDDHAVNSKNIRFVYSFPRSSLSRGGWQQLCQAVWELRQVEIKRQSSLHSTRSQDDDLWYDTDDGDGDEVDFGVRTVKKIKLFAMSGSFGDLKPDFLLQMRMAMSGYKSVSNDAFSGLEGKKPTLSLDADMPWSSIDNTFCLWPSSETVLKMNPIAILGRCRPVSRKHWGSIPDQARKRIFFDAIPNPDGPSLQSSTESQEAAGVGRNLAPNLLGLRLRSGPLSAYHTFSHGKAIFATTMSNAAKEGKLPLSNTDRANANSPYASVYVGSHNFSKKAWGMRDSRPGNVEFGVVLLTTDCTLAGSWRSRLPYVLPSTSAIAPSTYQPGRLWDIFQPVERICPMNTNDDSSVETI